MIKNTVRMLFMATLKAKIVTKKRNAKNKRLTEKMLQ